MDASLLISCKDLSDEDLQLLTGDLTNTLNRETELTGTLAEQTKKKGAKGEPITIGMIILTALSSGTVVALFNVLKSYFERRSSLEMVIKRADGEEFTIRAENLSSEQVDETIKMANEFLEE